MYNQGGIMNGSENHNVNRQDWGGQGMREFDPMEEERKAYAKFNQERRAKFTVDPFPRKPLSVIQWELEQEPLCVSIIETGLAILKRKGDNNQPIYKTKIDATYVATFDTLEEALRSFEINYFKDEISTEETYNRR